MSHPEGFKQWSAEVSSQMPHLSKTQAMILALYSFGMVLTKHCGLTTIVTFLSLVMQQPPQNLRQRLREWNYEAQQKRGQRRQAITASHSFAPLLRWIMSDWQTPGQLTMAMDVTYLGDRFTILAISVLYRGCALPIAWRILPGNAKGAWHPLWLELLTHLKPGIPKTWMVYVLTDRGLYSKRLFQTLTKAGWHPLMRIRPQGVWRRERAKTWKDLSRLARPGIGIWCQRVVCFKGDPLVCTLLVQWNADYDEPCLLVTDVRPVQVKPNLYALRAWIEAGFKDVKRGGLHWEQSKMTAADRAERLWLVIAVALIWLIRVGGEAQHIWQSLTTVPASLSCLTLGWLTLLVNALLQQPLPHGRFFPYDWHKAPG